MSPDELKRWHRIENALVDAATVDATDFEKGVRELTEERDAYRAALADIVWQTKPGYVAEVDATAWNRARSLLKYGVVRPASPHKSDPNG